MEEADLRRLADALVQAEARYASGRLEADEDVVLAQNAIIEHLDLPPDETERGLTFEAAKKIVEFRDRYRTDK